MSPEDLFREVLCVLDAIKEEPDEALEKCEGLWLELYCDFRDKADEPVPDEELSLGVCVTMLIVMICLGFDNRSLYTRMTLSIQGNINEHRLGWCSLEGEMLSKMHDSLADLSKWATDYMDSDTFITDEYGNLCMDEDTEEEKPEYMETYVFNGRIKYAIDILNFEGVLKYSYDYTWIMLVMNQMPDMLHFDTALSFLRFFSAELNLERLPSESTISKKKKNTLGQHPSWTFRDVDDVNETRRRNNVAARFLSIVRKG